MKANLKIVPPPRTNTRKQLIPVHQVSSQLKQQFIHHCACIIQSRFKGYIARKRYNQFLPVYRRLQMLFLAVWKGWKTRKILKLNLMKGKITSIKVKSTGTICRIAKRELLDDFWRLWKNGNWVEVLKKQKQNGDLYKLNESHKENSKNLRNVSMVKSIKEVFRPAKHSASLIEVKNVKLNGKEKQKKSEVIDKIQPEKFVHSFDQIPIKSSKASIYSQIQEFEFPQNQKQSLNKANKKKKTQKIEKTQPQMSIQLPISTIIKTSQNSQRKKLTLTLSTRQRSKASTLQSSGKDQHLPCSSFQLVSVEPETKNHIPFNSKISLGDQQPNNLPKQDIFQLQKVYNSTYFKKWHELGAKIQQIRHQKRFSGGIHAYSKLC